MVSPAYQLLMAHQAGLAPPREMSDLPCTHRGDVLGQTLCRGCPSSRVETDVSACAVHGMCAVRAVHPFEGNKVKGVCLGCTDLEEPSVEQAKPMLFVWPFRNKPAKYDELRWSIRSVYQHYQGEVSTLLVGDKPRWYSGDWIKRPLSRSPFRDVIQHMIQFANDDRFPDEAVWMMDDVYFLKDFGDEYLGTQHHGTIQTPEMVAKWKPTNKWGRMKKRTAQRLFDEGRATVKDFALHMPYPIHRHQLREVIDRYDLRSQEFTWETLYGNNFWESRHWKRPRNFLRIHHKASLSALEESTKGMAVFNHNSGSWNEDLRRFLYATFPEKTVVETQEAVPCKK